ncbi:MAG: helix-turn-helix transcriptional regulator [Candidatus Hodarchaeota archaeon]
MTDDEVKLLTDNELQIFLLVNEGKGSQRIADELNKKDSYIRKTKSVIRAKLDRELRKVANSLRLDLDLTNISKDTGFMIGFDWIHNTKVYLVFTVERGIIAWWEHECLTEECRKRNQEMLDLICRERKIKLSSKEKDLSLLEQFRIVLEKIQEKSV